MTAGFTRADRSFVGLSMEHSVHVAGHTAGRPARLIRGWWPLPAFVVAGLVSQQVLLDSRYDVGGHAAEHLAGASVPFVAAPVVGLLFWATPAARRQIDVLVVTVAWLATTVIVMLGNLRVVDDLVDAGYPRTPTGSVPDVADHGLANSSVWWAYGVGLLVVIAWHRRDHIGNRATVAAVISGLIVPPWLIPGFGVIVLAVVRLVRRGQADRVTGVVRSDALVSPGAGFASRRSRPAGPR